MTLLTLIPDARTYGITIFLLFGMGCSSLATLIHYRWFFSNGVRIVTVHAWVKVFVALLGGLLIPMQAIFGTSFIKQGFSILVGLIAGWLIVRIEKCICKSWSVTQVLEYDELNRYRHEGPSGNSIVAKPAMLTLSSKSRESLQHSTRLQHSVFNASTILKISRFSLLSIILVACSEELIFRGFFMALCLSLSHFWLISISLIGTVVLFGFSHIDEFSQVLSKIILGTIALLLTLTMGTVLPAMIAHMYLNIRAYQELGGRLFPIPPLRSH